MQVGIHLKLRLRGTLPINITRQSIYPDKLQMLQPEEIKVGYYHDSVFLC